MNDNCLTSVAAEIRLQFQHAGERGGDYFTDHSKIETKYEAQATWTTPHGVGRYRIWHRVGDYYDVVRLKPSTGTWKLNGRSLKFSGRSLATARTYAEAVIIAERDNAQLTQREGGDQA